jgi:hypothetical protein
MARQCVTDGGLVSVISRAAAFAAVTQCCVMLALAACGGGGGGSSSSPTSDPPPPVAVPSVIGDAQSAATTAITGAGLVLGSVTKQSSNTVAAGSVISESPIAGTSVAGGSAVNLVISTGPAPVSVPNVVGDAQSAATTAITGAGLTIGTVTMQSSNTAASGNVISESPVAGTSVASGSAVNLVVAAMPPGLWVSGTLVTPSQSVDNNFIGLMDSDGFFVFANWNSYAARAGDPFYIDTCSNYAGTVSVLPSGALVGSSTRWGNPANPLPQYCAGQYNNPIGLSGSINLTTGVLTLTETEGPISGMPSGVSETFTAPISPLFTVPPASLTALQGTWLSDFIILSGIGNSICMQGVLGYAEPCQFVIDASGNVTSSDVNGTGTGTVSIPNAADNIIDLHLSYPNGVTARGIWFHDTVDFFGHNVLVGWAVTYDSSGNAINMFQTTVVCDGC